MFSDREGLVDKTIFQKDAMDSTLKNDIWNLILKFYLDDVRYINRYSDINEKYSRHDLKDCLNSKYILNLYTEFFIIPLDDKESYSLDYNKSVIKDLYFKLEWFKVYDLIEHLYNFIPSMHKTAYKNELNKRLIRNNSAYRCMDGKICPVISVEELDSISESLKNPFDEVSDHIKKAVEYFSDRKSPDYENSIKESITAVETLCSIIVGKKSTLGEAIKTLKTKGLVIHPSLESAFIKLYGYTSDAKGVRHAGDIGGKASSFEEAKFMLVSCSAFVNYLMDCNNNLQ